MCAERKTSNSQAARLEPAKDAEVQPRAGTRQKAPRGADGKTALVWVLFAALAVMTLSGVGTIGIVSVLGLVLCGVGMSQSTARIDWWVLIPLAVYVGMNLVSSLVTFQDVVNGYGGVQLIYVSMYALSCCLDERAARRLRQLCVLWAGIAAALGIVGFAASSFFVSVTRLAFVVGAPNALGIFLVLGWFALLTCRLDEGADDRLTRIIGRL